MWRWYLQVARLQKLADNYGVDMEICTEQGRADIVMTGLPQILYNDMIRSISEELSRAQKNQEFVNAARLKQITVQWSYQNLNNGLWEDFDVEINQVWGNSWYIYIYISILLGDQVCETHKTMH